MPLRKDTPNCANTLFAPQSGCAPRRRLVDHQRPGPINTLLQSMRCPAGVRIGVQAPPSQDAPRKRAQALERPAALQVHGCAGRSAVTGWRIMPGPGKINRPAWNAGCTLSDFKRTQLGRHLYQNGAAVLTGLWRKQAQTTTRIPHQNTSMATYASNFEMSSRRPAPAHRAPYVAARRPRQRASA